MALAQTSATYEQVGLIDTSDLGLPYPAGLAFSPADNTFFFLLTPQQPGDTTAIVAITPFEELIGMVNFPIPGVDPLNMTFDSQANRLLLFDATTNTLIEIKVGPAGLPDPTTVTRIEAQPFGLQQPQGMAVDAGGRLFILDRAGPRLIRIQPDPTPGLDSTTALAQGQVSQIDLKPLGLANVRGLAFNPANGHLYLLSLAAQTLYELTKTGRWVTTYDLASFKLNNPQGLVFAPSRDTTDASSLINLFITDKGLSAEAGQKSMPGKVIEFSFRQPLVSALNVHTMNASLVQTTLTSQFSPPSPDPSGLAYIPSSNTLLISDGEVDEMPQYFTGKNVFGTSLSGSLVGTLTTLPFSQEPAGVAYNPFNHHLYFSDDTDGKKIHELNPGSDGLYNTSDDIITSFTTTTFGSFDPEGIAYDSWQGHLHVVDGVNEEVYRIAPGANGKFDGPPPAGDDVVTQFDVTVMGLKDTEGIEFNPDNGHLYILSGKKKLIAETTRDGVLIRTINISSLNAVAASGLAYAPASGNSAVKNIYIVDRGIDNGIDPNENDGKMYEISFPALVTTSPASVAVSGPAMGSIQISSPFTATVSPVVSTLPLTYTWQATEQAPLTRTNDLSDKMAFTWSTPGTKAITVTATNNQGTVTRTHLVTIIAPPTSVALNGPTSGIVHTSYTFTAMTGPNTTTLPLTYTWQATGQPLVIRTNGLSDTVAFTWDTPGTKTITVTAANPAGMVTTTHFMTIIAPPASITLNGPTNGIVQATHTFMATTTPSNTTLPLTYTWQATDQALVTHTNNLSDTVAFTWDTPGSKAITVTATNAAGSVTVTHTVTINVPPTELTLAGPTTGLVHEGYSFIATTTPGTATLPLTYRWQATGQPPITHTNELSDAIIFNWPTPGTKAITVTATNAAGSVTVTHTVTIMAPPAGLTLNGPPDGVIQEGYTFTTAVNPITTTLPLTYRWEATGQPPMTQTNNLNDAATFTWPTPGTKAITVTAANAAGSVTATHFVTIKVPPTAVTLAGPATGLINDGYSFIATTTPSTATLPLTYTWQATGQTPVTHTNNLSNTITFTWSVSSTQVITVTVTNGSGTAVQAVSEVLIIAPEAEAYQIYLPIVLKSGVALD